MEVSLTRIWLLFKKQWIDHQKMYLLGILAMGAIMMALFLFFTNPDFSSKGLTLDMQGAFLFIGLILFGGVFTSTLFNQFDNKPNGIQMLMVPASALEKTLTAILFSNVFFPLIYMLLVYPILIFVHYIEVQILGNLNELFDFKYEVVWGFTIVSYLVLNIALFCSILFRRYTFIKSAIVVCVLLFGSIFLNQKIARMIVENAQPNATLSTFNEQESSAEKNDIRFNLQSAIPFYSLGFLASEGKAFVTIRLPWQQAFLYNFIFYGIIITLLWSVTWFKLQEKQI